MEKEEKEDDVVKSIRTIIRNIENLQDAYEKLEKSLKTKFENSDVHQRRTKDEYEVLSKKNKLSIEEKIQKLNAIIDNLMNDYYVKNWKFYTESVPIIEVEDLLCDNIIFRKRIELIKYLKNNFDLSKFLDKEKLLKIEEIMKSEILVEKQISFFESQLENNYDCSPKCVGRSRVNSEDPSLFYSKMTDFPPSSEEESRRSSTPSLLEPLLEKKGDGRRKSKRKRKSKSKNNFKRKSKNNSKKKFKRKSKNNSKKILKRRKIFQNFLF